MHAAIVMDGNRRWARLRGLAPADGHAAGEAALRQIVMAAPRLGVRTLTVFGFSTENWSRGSDEVGALMRLIASFASIRKDELLAAGIRVRVRGDLARLPFAARAALRALERASSGNSRLTLVLAINYGGRDEILRAVRSIARDRVAHDAITEDVFRSHLDLPDVGDPEIVIRTGGEQRLSNFLIYQCAYSEFVTLPVLWPDFEEEHLAQAVAQFGGRQRRFGA